MLLVIIWVEDVGYKCINFDGYCSDLYFGLFVFCFLLEGVSLNFMEILVLFVDDVGDLVDGGVIVV